MKTFNKLSEDSFSFVLDFNSINKLLDHNHHDILINENITIVFHFTKDGFLCDFSLNFKDVFENENPMDYYTDEEEYILDIINMIKGVKLYSSKYLLGGDWIKIQSKFIFKSN